MAVSGDRAHYVADLASNVVALAGIGADGAGSASAGSTPSPAWLVAAVLLWGAISVFRQASGQLMDHELPDEARARIVALMTAGPAADRRAPAAHPRLRPLVHIQMHADLDPALSLEAAHQVMVAAEKRVLEAFPAADIIIHPDPRGRAEPHGGAFAGGARSRRRRPERGKRALKAQRVA